MSFSLRLARFCGLAPLCTGVGIFLLWLLTRWSWLMGAGLFTLYAGVCLFVVGVVALFAHAGFGWANATVPLGKFKRTVFQTALVLVANFPVAWGIVTAAIAIETRYVVAIRNDSQQIVEHLRVWGGRTEKLAARLRPKESITHSLWFEADGDLQFDAVAGSKPLRTTIEVYVTPSMGGRADVVISNDGIVRVTRFDRRGREIPEIPSVSAKPLSEK